MTLDDIYRLCTHVWKQTHWRMGTCPLVVLTRECQRCGKVEHAATEAFIERPDTVWRDGPENLLAPDWRAELERRESR